MNFSEEKLIASFIINDSKLTLVDVGAHQGSFLNEFARKGWNVIAFEPERTNYNKLKDMFGDFPNVTCLQKAVYHTSGLDIPFYTSKKHYGIHSLKPFHKTHELSYNVNTIRLDEALKELKIENVDLLKIDIEGADFLALESFDFKKFNPEVVIIEFMDSRSLPNFGYSHHDAVAFMKKWNYIAYISEWEPIKEYGVEGEKSSHKWIQCVQYPLDHEPAWGNLIFVNEDSKEMFDLTLSNYLKNLRRHNHFCKLKKSFINLLPKLIINKLKSIKII